MLKLTQILTAVLLFHFLYQGEAASQASNPEGELQKAKFDDIWAQTLQGSNFNEFWNYHFYLDDGFKVHITFSAANFGSFKSPVSGVRVSVLKPGGKLYQVSREYPLDRLFQDKENFAFRPHPERDVYFKGKLPYEHEVRINITKDGVSYDIHLSLENIIPGFKWDEGKFKIGSEQIGIITHIPYAEVSGYVAVNDNRTQVAGTAYMDHTFQNQTTSRLMHSGYRFVYHDDPENWDILYFLYPSSRYSNTIGYRLVNRNNKVELQGAQQISNMTRSRSFKNVIAQDIELELDNSESVSLSRKIDEEVFSVFAELGWVQRRAARVFLGGEVLDFRGEAVLKERGNKPKRGHYNFFKVE